MADQSSVRMDKDTIDRLTAYRDRLRVQIRSNPKRYPAFLACGKLGLTDAVNYLLYQQDQHSERSRRRREPATALQPTAAEM